MAVDEHRVFYQTSNSYSTLNTLTNETQNVWIACHGLGFLSQYFIRYFRTLDPAKNYIIAPQAPSKYYQNKDFKYVGASWLTRVDTRPETQNVLRYLTAVFEKEAIPQDKKLILFGFSQGVSVIMRWMAAHKIDPQVLVIYAGSIPKELTPQDFAYVKEATIKVVYGTDDEYINAENGRLEKEIDLAKRLFGNEKVGVVSFAGKHEMKPEVVAQLNK